MADIAETHQATLAWTAAMSQVREAMQARGVSAADVVVLVPYAQLIHEARQAWLRTAPAAGAGFLPRFESTMNWTRALGAVSLADDDLRFDAALDALTARSLVERAGLGRQQALLAPRVMEAAWSLAATAAAVAPAQRLAWGRQLGEQLGMAQSPMLALEGVVARVALAWAASSAYATDVLFGAEPALLVVIDGFQAEPVAEALKRRLAGRCLTLKLHATAPDAWSDPAQPGSAPRQCRLHAAEDAEDEAALAAACVLRHLQGADGGSTPVALVALDRQLTRRVRAMLGEQGVAIRDETGWKLSTTRAAASLMSLLRASRADASADEVLDWLKNTAPAQATEAANAVADSVMNTLESELRRVGMRNWPHPDTATTNPGLPHGSPSVFSPASLALLGWANGLRAALQRSRTLPEWLAALAAALAASGQHAALLADAAGRNVLQALHLSEGAPQAFARFAQHLSLGEFTAWVSQVLEAANFAPPHPPQAQVVILPLSQLLGRDLRRVVMAGCDEERLQAVPEPPGPWTPVQRELLGLPSRDALAQAQRDAWHAALQSPQVDVLWRQSQDGEPLMPSPLVQLLQLAQRPPSSASSASGAPGAASDAPADPRPVRVIQPAPGAMPHPDSSALPVARLSASAYGDLRRCPYRFFALRQLRLGEAEELDTELDKRDFGNWLHRTLHIFHEGLKQQDRLIGSQNQAQALVEHAQTAMLNVAAEQATQELGLSAPEFLPFAASWPRVRDGYLEWLAGHTAAGATYQEGEAWRETPLGSVTLVGKLDRIDRQKDGSALVIDYKTESRSVTQARIKAGMEDSQLAFYAALVHDDTLSAAYVNVGEKDGTRECGNERIVELRDALVEGVLHDMARINQGAPMPAMGEGQACDYCDARGLCRKDFWV